MTLLVTRSRKSCSRGRPRSLDPKSGVFGVNWGQNLINFKHGQFTHQNDALDQEITKKLFSRSTEVTRPQIRGYKGSFGVKIQIFSNLGKKDMKLKLLKPWLQKSGFRGHPRSSDPKSGGIRGHLVSKSKDFQTYANYISKWSSSCPDYKKLVSEVTRGHPTKYQGVLGVILGQNQKIFKPRLIIYQNEALASLITEKWFPRSREVIRTQIRGYVGSFGVKIQSFSNLGKL